MSECAKSSRERRRKAVVDRVDNVSGRYMRICKTVESLADVEP